MIPVNDLSHSLQSRRQANEAAIARVLDSGWLVLGKEVEAFEAEFAKYCTSQYCVGVANGTDALELALKAVQIKPGSSVATVANAGAYTLTALLAVGAQPHFLDVEQHSACVSLAAVEHALKSGVDAVVVTHLFGRVVPEIDAIARLCQAYGKPLIEDCAQAHGATLNGIHVGSFGDVGTFSFYPTKNLGALGDGGAIVTSNLNIKQRLTALRQYGWDAKYTIAMTGGRNSRLDELQAAVLRAGLAYLDAHNEERISAANYYIERIKQPLVELPTVPQNKTDTPYVAHLFVLQCENRAALQAHLRAEGIGSDIHYPIPDHQQTHINATTAQVVLPVTERLARESLSLPLFVGISRAQQDQVIKAINGFGL